ncbi:MAG TPA: lactate racemase domain-containing protein, partial [Spirochaetota bacterium]|nr:lactate racemase domain-containing protein [Spirochaetota bacterium]
MRIELPWGPGALHLETPDTWTVHFPRLIQSPKAPPRDELKPVRDALRRPVGARALSALTLKNKNILIVVDDNTRPTPTHTFFHLVIDELKKA